MPENGLIRGLACEAANIVKQVAPIITGIGIIVAPVWLLANDWFNAWMELPEKVARIEARLGDPGRPFVEFEGPSRMWPNTVRPGQWVQVTYMARRNRACDVTVARHFQMVTAGSIDPALSSSGMAVTPPLTLGFELFTVWVRIPEQISAGYYAYRPTLTCTGEHPVQPPPVFFEVTE